MPPPLWVDLRQLAIYSAIVAALTTVACKYIEAVMIADGFLR